MRKETPFDFFHIMSTGKISSAMPAWGEVLSLQDRWDLLSYVWSVQPGESGLAEGQGVYLSQCAGCHGATGDGRGPWSSSLLTPAAALDQPSALARQSDQQLFTTVTDGVPGTPMPGFGRTLSDAERWAAVAYLRALSLGGAQATQAAVPLAAEPRRFAGLLRMLAQEYTKANPPGASLDALEYRESLVLLQLIREQRDAALAALAQHASGDTKSLPDQLDQIARTVADRGSAATVQSLATSAALTIERLVPAEPAGGPDADPLGEVRRMLDDALAAYRDGKPDATYLVSDAYFKFEPIETQLATSAPQITRQVEASFLELRGTLAKPGNEARAAELVAAIGNDLDRARAALAPAANDSGLFFQSATIILREGFEVVLIVGALLAYVMKSGQTRMRRPILWGAGIGVVLSLLTAYALELLFRGNPAIAEALEGLTMLLASAVLFSVSYWLISKAEADKWQRYIQGKVQAALSRASSLALAGAAFLAVYREGVETVLFYRALLGTGGTQVRPVVAGFVTGLVGLAILYAAFARFGRRIPIRPFFLGTSILLYYLAFVFAGRGVAELQQIGWVSVTPLPFVPRVDFFGIHPTMETCLVQGLLLLLLLYAIYVTLGSRRVAAPVEPLLAEMRALRDATIGLRAELAQLPARDPQSSRHVGERVEALIGRVAELEGQMTLALPPNGGRKRVSGHAA